MTPHYVAFLGGVLANSLAIATDAAHLLTDFASFMISLLALYLASRPATTTMSFGWHRAGTVFIRHFPFGLGQVIFSELGFQVISLKMRKTHVTDPNESSLLQNIPVVSKTSFHSLLRTSSGR